MASDPETRTIELRDVGPVEHLSIEIPSSGGIIVLRGKNGTGKSHSLDAVSALLGRKDRPPSRDGSLGAQVEGLGARLTVGRRATHSGTVEVSRLEGEDPSLLVDPGFKSAEAADAARIRALLRLSHATVDVSAFAALVGGMERLEELCKPSSLDGDGDVPTMAAAIKRDLEGAARSYEASARNGFAKSEGVRSTLREVEGSVLEVRCDSAEDARQQHTQAVREHQALETRRDSSATAIQAAKDAREALAAMGDDGSSASILQTTEAYETASSELDDLKVKLAAAEAVCEKQASELERQEKSARQREPLQRAVEAGKGLEPVADQEVDALANAVKAAEADVSAWALRERTQGLREDVERIGDQAKIADREAAALRDAARGTETVMLQAVRAVCGDDMELEDGRLYVRTDRGRELFSDLSQGERWRRALDIAVAAIGPTGLLVIRQEAFEGLDPSNRLEIGTRARELGVVILTAESTDGDLRAEAMK